MATNQQSLLRQWHMLRMVPRCPAKISARDLCDRLCAADFTVTKRTVERDLKELAAVFPIVVDSRDKPFGWSWLRDASSFDLPGLTVPEALTLTLVEQHLRHHLPPIPSTRCVRISAPPSAPCRPSRIRRLRGHGSTRCAACRHSSRCYSLEWMRNASATSTWR